MDGWTKVTSQKYYAIQICVPNRAAMSALSRSLDSADIHMSAVRYTNVNFIVDKTFFRSEAPLQVTLSVCLSVYLSVCHPLTRQIKSSLLWTMIVLVYTAENEFF